jgi:hypothetical protein
MIFETGDPECLLRQPIIFQCIVGTAMPTSILASPDDAPGPEATKTLGRATIHPAVTDTAAAGRTPDSIAAN